MEMNQEITKNKKKLPTGLVICLAIVIVCAVVSAGAIILKNIPSFQNKEILGTMEVADAETLREALLAEADCTITLTEDIVVREELLVNGTKKLCGDKSIIMDTSNIGSGQSVCAVNGGATLVLDGATLDGNGVVNGLGVKVGGKLTCLSGGIVYGYPYGITTAGFVEIEDVTIDRIMHTAIYAEYGGEVHMTGGTLTNNVYGVSVASGAYMSISGDAVLTKSNATVVTNYGKMEITGGSYSDCFDNVITNQGELSIIGDGNKKIELANSKRSAIVSKKNSKLTVENCYMHDLGLHALAIEKGSEGSLVNCVIERTGKSSFYANSSTLAMKDIEISSGESYGLSAVSQSKIEMENVTIKDMKSRGVGIDESQLIAKNLEVKDTKSTGLYVVGEKAVVEVEGLTLVKNGASALGIKSGKVKAKDVTIEESKNEGVYVDKEAKLDIEDANIHKTGMHSFMNYGTATAKNIKITDSNKIGIKTSDGSSLTIKDVVIKNAASHALCIEKDSVANVTNCDIDNAGKTGNKAAVYVSQSKLNMKQSTIHDVATYAIAAKDCKKADEKVVNLNDITISKTEGHGIGNVGSYVVAGNIKVSETKRAGIYTEGTDSITNMNQIEVVNAGTCGFGFKAGEITARNVTITTPTNEGVYVMKDANVKKLDNAVITDPGTQGVNVAGGTINITVDKKYNPDNTKENGVTVTNPKLTGIKCVEGTIKAQGVTITNAKNHAFDVEKGSVVTVNGCEIDKTGKAAVYVLESKMTMKNAKIDNAASYGIGVRDSKKAEGNVVNLDNITITNAGERGIGNFNSYVVAGNIKISNPKGAGIYTEGIDSITNMNQIEVTNAGTCGFGFKAGEITARNVTILSPTDEGIVVQKDANVKKLDNVTIKNPGAHGIANFGGNVNVTVDKKYNPDNTSGNGITIINPGKHGIYHEKETNGTTTLAHVYISTPKTGYGIWNRGGKVTGSNVTIENSKLAGVNISKDATVKLDNANIIKAGDQGILCDGTLIVTNVVNSKNGVTITEPKTHGIYLSSTGRIEGAKEGAAAVGVEIVKTGKIGILAEGSTIKVSGLTLKEIASQGLQFKGGQAEISNFSVGKTGSAAVKIIDGADVKLTDGTISAHSYAIATEGAVDIVSKVKATNVKVERANEAFKEELVAVGANTEFTLAGEKSVIDGKNTKETSQFTGRGVRVYGTFTMYDGTILRNKGGNGAGVRVEKGATFTMNGGTIKENAISGTSKGFGAGLLVQGTFILNDGIISNHGSEGTHINVEGTGVCLSADSAVFTMNGGEIRDNYATAAGAGVAMVDGNANYPQFTINGGKITGNHTTGSVGGIVVRTGIFTMNEGATISDNTAAKLAGGMSLEGSSKTTFNLNGGTFANNSSGTGGDDIYLSGKITLAKALTEKDVISIKPSSYTEGKVIAVKGEELTEDEFKTSMKYISVEPNGTTNYIVTDEGKLGQSRVRLEATGQIYSSLEDAVAAANATSEKDTITILENLTVAESIKITENVEIVSGKTDMAVTIIGSAKLSGDMFQVEAGKKLNITGTASGKIELVCNNSNVNVIKNNGTLEITYVSITGGKMGINVQSGGTMTASYIEVSGTAAQGIYFIGVGATGTISNFILEENGSAAVRVMDGAKVTLNDGTIYAYNYGIATSGKSETYSEASLTDVKIERASKDGKYTTNALVSVGNNSKLELYDTTTSTEAKTVLDGKYAVDSHAYEGRGVVVEDAGTFIMHGGIIQNNKADVSAESGNGNGAGVLLKSGASFTMNGGTIQNNTAKNGGGVAMMSGTNEEPVFTMNGGTITRNHATTNAGGVALSNGIFTLNEGAALSGNTAVKLGGGISMDGGAATARPSFILNGGTFGENTATEGGSDMNCTGGSAKIKLQKALTSNIYVKPNAYNDTRVMAEKNGAISDEDFAESMKYIIVDSNNGEEWHVATTGKLAKTGAILQTADASVHYASLKDAINAAAEGSTIKICEDVTITETITKPLTLTSDKAVTIKAADNMKGIMFSIATGKTMSIIGAASDKKISIEAGRSGQNVIQSYGTANLTNVSTSGGKRGIYIGAGSVNLSEVSISDCTNEGLRVDAGGVNVTASGLYIENTGSNGVYLKGASGNKATGTISNFEIKGTSSAAVKVENSDLELKKGRIETNTYCLVTSDASSQLNTEEVTIKTTFEKPFSINGDTPNSYQSVTFE
ncbi:MAG: right-handed parallel beta-helix repeat-containing protein [Tyzzerella sp.]|nr:right-handed parallel beta-helix repeat-containing protein [Tyzzerella sp.]